MRPTVRPVPDRPLGTPRDALEAEILRETLLALSALPGVVVWRQNSGLYYTPDGRGGWRRVRAAIPGAADITGLIRGDHGDGHRSGRRLEIECKTRAGRQSEDQRAFQRVIEDHGGLYVLARSAEEAVAAVRGAMG